MKTLPLPKGLLFDMDGVLLHATQNPDESWQVVCQHFAPTLGLSPHDLAEALAESRQAYRREIAHDLHLQQRDRLQPFETRREKVEQALASLGKEDHAVATEMVHAFEHLRDEHRHLTPFAHETLRTLRERGLRLALISNGNATYQRRKIAQHHLAPFFDAILLEEEFGIAKPDQRIFLAALAQLRLIAPDAWMVGDNLISDIAGAQSLGIAVIWYDLAQTGLPQDATCRPDGMIQALPELLDLLREAGSSV